MSLFSLPFRWSSRGLAPAILAALAAVPLTEVAVAQTASGSREALCRSRAEAYAGAPRSDAPDGLRLGDDRAGITFFGTVRIGISVQEGKLRRARSRSGSEAEDRDDYFNTPEAQRKRLAKQYYRDCMSQR
ncbi:hypothetical protein VWX97_14940 [Phaeobacter sp. JH18-32]|uniref:hypothetical protein n=1 Tax=Phaeobacter TaxID=302485 RepID=UPI003A8A51BF